MKNLFIGLLVLLLSSAVNASGSVYAQLSSANDQVGGMINTEIVDDISRMEVDGSGIKVQTNGVYMVVLAPQTGDIIGCGNYWIAINAADVDNSNIRVCQNHAGDTTVAVSQSVMVLMRGDVITFHMSGVLGIDATQPSGEPLIPSVIISVFKL